MAELYKAYPYETVGFNSSWWDIPFLGTKMILYPDFYRF